MAKATKTIIWIVVIALVIWGIVAISDNNPQEVSSDEPIKIGAILPLTGPLADVGNASLQAMELAAEEINLSGGVIGREIVLIPEDSEGCNPQKAVDGMNKLINVDKVGFVYSLCSGPILSSHPIAEKAKVLHLGSAGSPEISEAGKYMFRLVPPETQAVRVIADYMIDELNHKNIALIYCDNDWCLVTKEAFTSYVENERQMELVVEEQIESSSNDVNDSILKISQALPDSVFVAAYPPESLTLFKQSEELGLHVPFFGAPTWLDSSLAENSQGFAENKYFVVQHEGYSEEFSEKMNGNILLATPQAYDSVYVLVKAIESARTINPEIVRENLLGFIYEGESGHIEFDETGNLLGSYYDIKGFENGSFYDVKTKLTPSN